jgi:hypothetical protein
VITRESLREKNTENVSGLAKTLQEKEEDFRTLSQLYHGFFDACEEMAQVRRARSQYDTCQLQALAALAILLCTEVELLAEAQNTDRPKLGQPEVEA